MKHFHEVVTGKKHKLKLSYTLMRSALQDAVLVEKAVGRGKHRRKRERRPLMGMLVHLDGSKHEWIAGLPMQDLIVALDDADGRILFARFVEQEGTRSTLEALRAVLTRYGRFAELYTDRGSHFARTPRLVAHRWPTGRSRAPSRPSASNRFWPVLLRLAVEASEHSARFKVAYCRNSVVLDAAVLEVAFPHELPRITCSVGCAESAHFCALLESGSVECWGDRFVGQLGDGSEAGVPRTVPLSVEGLPAIIDIDSGPGHVCALGVDHSVWCWGSNLEGQLGDGGMTTRTRPVRVGGLAGVRPIALALGSYHSCALLDDGGVACWGAPWAFGERGDRRTARVLDVPRPIVELLAGHDFTCGRDADGGVFCGGYSYSEEDHFSDEEAPQHVRARGFFVVALTE
jgi:hypothetical protein